MKLLKLTVMTMALTALVASAAVSQPPGGPGGQRPGGPPPGGPNDGGPGQAVLQALDADGNHEISAEEIANAATALKKLDVNGDGKLTDDDLRGDGRGEARNQGGGPGSENRRPGQRAREQGGRDQGGRDQGGRDAGARDAGGQPGPGGPPPGAGGRPSPDQFVEQAMEFDADKDGKLDATELRKFAEQMGPPNGPRRERGGRGENQDGPQQNRPQRPSRPE